MKVTPYSSPPPDYFKKHSLVLKTCSKIFTLQLSKATPSPFKIKACALFLDFLALSLVMETGRNHSALLILLINHTKTLPAAANTRDNFICLLFFHLRGMQMEAKRSNNRVVKIIYLLLCALPVCLLAFLPRGLCRTNSQQVRCQQNMLNTSNCQNTFGLTGLCVCLCMCVCARMCDFSNG